LNVEDNQRFFKILYDDADYLLSDNVEWMDENTPYEHGSNPVDGEGGVWGFIGDLWSWISNIGDSNETIVWAHDTNTLFDEDASTSKDENRKIVIGEDSDQVKYFNRGIISTIPKNRLKYLPLKELNFSSAFDEAYVCTVGEETLQYNVPIKIVIKGKWGRILDEVLGEEIGYCLPSVVVSEHYRNEPSETADHVVGTASGKDSRRSYTEGEFGKLYDYEIIIELSKLPTHIMKEVDFFTITLGITPDENVQIDSVSGVMAYYTKLVEAIKTYERKYLVSTLSTEGTVNPDGPNTEAYRAPSPNSKSNGQYFPLTQSNYVSQNETKAVDKMTMIGASKFYIDNATTSVGSEFAGGGGVDAASLEDQDSIKESGPLSVTVGNLKTIEKEEQKKLYEDATGRDTYDTLVLAPYTHPKFDVFVGKIGLYGKLKHSNLIIESNKLLWDKHWLVTSFIQDGLEFFTLGGHYFTWADYVYKTRCTIFGPVETVYSVVFVHRHCKSVPTASAYEAYAGWVKFRYIEGRVQQIEGVATPKVDLVSQAITGVRG